VDSIHRGFVARPARLGVMFLGVATLAAAVRPRLALGRRRREVAHLFGAWGFVQGLRQVAGYFRLDLFAGVVFRHCSSFRRALSLWMNHCG
jgi:hypothetical protein